jgi:ABC-2 type transport system permease protein
MSKAWIVAKKEIKDNIKSKRYWALLAILVLFGIALSTYITVMIVSTPTEEKQERLFTSFWSRFVGSLSFMLPIIGLSLGFSAISGERERGTIRLVLARPIYRDDLLNGKLIAGALLILLALFVSYTLIIPSAILLRGMNLTATDVAKLLLLMIPSELLALVYLSISLFFSTISNRSGTSLVLSIIAWILFNIIMPILAYLAAVMILGPPPALPTPTSGVPQIQDYYQKFTIIVGTILSIVPDQHFSRLASAIYGRQEPQEIYVPEILTNAWVSLLVLTGYIIVFLALSYTVFVKRQENK